MPDSVRDQASGQDTKQAWTVYEQPAEGFAISLPSPWKQLGDPAKLKPGLKAMGVKFVATEMTPDVETTGMHTNMNVTKQTLPFAMSLDAVGQNSVVTAEAMPSVVKPVSRQSVTLRCGEAVRLQYYATSTDAKGQAMTLVSRS